MVTCRFSFQRTGIEDDITASLATLGIPLLKQVLQNLRTGVIELADVPCPMVRAGHLLVQTTCSLISPGTERSLVEFGQAGLLGKARAQPDKVRQVLERIRSDGLLPTLETVFSRLDEPLPLGYCNVGRVIEVGAGVTSFRIGDCVASNGPHAEIAHVPATLAARAPDGVDDEAAAFTVLGAIALHGVRLTRPTFGESFAVIGLGLVGLLVAQFLRGHGCRVIGMDTNASRCAHAKSFGCEAIAVEAGMDPVHSVKAFTGGSGVDGVVIAASAESDEVIHQAAQMCRKRGRIVLVGVVGLSLRRSDFYEKELTFQVSCSYGPGRHDPAYESGRGDYPVPYVRWTAARNFEAVLNALAERRIEVASLISHRVPHSRAAQAYAESLTDPKTLGIVLAYPQQPAPTERTIVLRPRVAQRSEGCTPVVGMIGAGQFAKHVLLPAIRKSGAAIRFVASATGVSGVHAARKFDAEQTTTDYREVLDDSSINVVFIATRHGDHARLTAEAVKKGKHVFVEKPLAIDAEGVDQVRRAHEARPDLHIMVGFNRRFAPHALKVRQMLANRVQPVAARVTVNAGEIAEEHWARDPLQGGGRVVGEACHFVDLLMFLVGSPIRQVHAAAVEAGNRRTPSETMTIHLLFADGSIGAIDYWCNGPRSFPKERVEIFSEKRAVVIENWRRLQSYDWPGMPRMRMRQDKGYTQEISSFLRRVAEGGMPLVPFEDLELVSEATFAAVQSVRNRAPVPLRPAETRANELPLPEVLIS
jgi:predicted dehydrogenase/threonine dehydrogenase-like Zn-dependent dehydrogenase